MKNKKLLYILVPLTILIWGAVVFTIISHTRPDNAPDMNYGVELRNEVDTAGNKYTLLANYRDPFRYGSSQKPAAVKKPVQQKSQTVRNQNPVRVNWPDIEYKGSITNNNDKVALIRINNRNFLLKEGEARDNIMLVRMYPDSVNLEYSGEVKSIKKKSIETNVRTY